MSRIFTYEEVAKHKTDEDIWVIYENRVLDITKFLPEHPGSEDVLMEHAGGDLTQAFEDIGHSPEALAMMDKYLIGTIDKQSPKPEKKKPQKSDSGSTNVQPQNPFANLVLPALIVALGIIGYYFYS